MIPLHYTDSCIFLELFSNVKGNKSGVVKAYLYDIGRKYNIMISNLNLGEISRELNKIENDADRVMAFHKINDIIKNIEISSPQFVDYILALELRRVYYKIEPADALHLAMAISNKASIFATLGEKELANNERVKEFCEKKGLKIKIIER